MVQYGEQGWLILCNGTPRQGLVRTQENIGVISKLFKNGCCKITLNLIYLLNGAKIN